MIDRKKVGKKNQWKQIESCKNIWHIKICSKMQVQEQLYI